MGIGCGAVGRASLPTSEIRGSNPVVGEILFITYQLYWKDDNKEKRARE